MAPVAKNTAVEVSLIAERMEGSEQPTHQAAAAPAHRRTHTCAHTRTPQRIRERFAHWQPDCLR